MLFWHLAGRWGQVRSDGVAVSLPLTHAVLGRLIAARRPSVTKALAQLARQDLVTLIDAGWLLSGSPPGELAELDPSSSGSGPESIPADRHGHNNEAHRAYRRQQVRRVRTA
jgi:CRP/FNR family cyclic AMP-dependent transcriptional regulator